jgi:hypothetical protein
MRGLLRIESILSLLECELVATSVICQSQVFATMAKEETPSPLMYALRKYDRVRK